MKYIDLNAGTTYQKANGGLDVTTLENAIAMCKRGETAYIILTDYENWKDDRVRIHNWPLFQKKFQKKFPGQFPVPAHEQIPGQEWTAENETDGNAILEKVGEIVIHILNN